MPKFNLDLVNFKCDECGEDCSDDVNWNKNDVNDERFVCSNCVSIFIKEARVERRKFEVHALYRHYDKFGVLLYVGITNDPVSRFTQHRSKSAWWLAVVDGGRTTYQRFGDRQALLEAERVAIITESPRYNSQHNG